MFFDCLPDYYYRKLFFVLLHICFNFRCKSIEIQYMSFVWVVKWHMCFVLFRNRLQKWSKLILWFKLFIKHLEVDLINSSEWRIKKLSSIFRRRSFVCMWYRNMYVDLDGITILSTHCQEFVFLICRVRGGVMARHQRLTKAGRAVEGHIPDNSGTETWPHQQELLGHLLQATGPLPRHLERTFPWEKRGKGRDAGVELTPGSVLGLNPQERKTCQQVNYLICPRGHAFLLNYCLGSPRRCRGDQILQAHIWP